MNNNQILRTLLILVSVLSVFKKDLIVFHKFQPNKLFLYNTSPFVKQVFLNFDLYFFNNKFQNMLNQYIIFMRNNPNKKLLLKIDTIGLENIKYNLFLNKYRLNFIVSKLVFNGISKKNIKYIICVKKNKFLNELKQIKNNKLIIRLI